MSPASPAITEAPAPAQPVELSDDEQARIALKVAADIRAEHPEMDPDVVLAAVIARINEAISSWEASSVDTAPSDAAQREDLFDADQLAELRKANGYGQVTVTRSPALVAVAASSAVDQLGTAAATRAWRLACCAHDSGSGSGLARFTATRSTVAAAYDRPNRDSVS
jgi:hypothetical protein